LKVSQHLLRSARRGGADVAADHRRAAQWAGRRVRARASATPTC